jgi:hypothetical protein
MMSPAIEKELRSLKTEMYYGKIGSLNQSIILLKGNRNGTYPVLLINISKDNIIFKK